MAIASGLTCVDYLTKIFHTQSLQDNIRYSPTFEEFLHCSYKPTFSYGTNLDNWSKPSFDSLNFSQDITFSYKNNKNQPKDCSEFWKKSQTQEKNIINIQNVFRSYNNSKENNVIDFLSPDHCAENLSFEDIENTEENREVEDILNHSDGPEVTNNIPVSDSGEADISDSETELSLIHARIVEREHSQRLKNNTRKRSSAEFLNPCENNDDFFRIKRPCISMRKMRNSLQKFSVEEEKLFVPITIPRATPHQNIKQ